MTELFLVPVTDDWIERFEETVVSEYTPNGDLPPELEGEREVRIWGTIESEDAKKRTLFEKMGSEDLVLFLYSGEFVGSGRVGETLESTELGERIWGSPERLIERYEPDYSQYVIGQVLHL